MTPPTGFYKIQSARSGGYLKGFSGKGEEVDMTWPHTEDGQAAIFHVTKEGSGYVVSNDHSSVESGTVDGEPVVVWGNQSGPPKFHWTIVHPPEDDASKDYLVHDPKDSKIGYWFDRSDIGFDPKVYLQNLWPYRSEWRFIKVDTPY